MSAEPEPGGRRGRVLEWLGNLSPLALAVIGVLVAGGVGAGGYYAYQTYDYIEHDNEFCLSCHLMVDPYERFARSAHQDLGCKDCHQPTLVERSRMGLTQFIENPEEIEAHAAVPNELCADCHMEEDPEGWASIANTAGHRVHLESDDPALEGLQCVECHSSSLHEFAASDQTCAQSGCHTDSGIQLGAMSDLTIHCAACHGFNAPVGSGGAELGEELALVAMAPDAETCLSCHAMQALAPMPEDDPHEGSCGSCHNPHTQETPAQAAETCASAGCHSDAEALTPFHRGLDEGVLEGCLYCHPAHDFQVDGSNCLACHADVFDDGGTAGADARRFGPSAGPPSRFVHAASAQLRAYHPGRPATGESPPLFLHAASVSRASSEGTVGPGPLDGSVLQEQERPPFRHDQHQAQDCRDCHATEPTHGALTVTTVADCRSCHHTAPVASDCVACHEDPGAGAPAEVTRTLRLSVGTRPDRSLPFDHDLHEGQGLTCSTCHAEGLARSAAEADCASCHVEHHAATNDCASCHAPAAPGAHAQETAHLGCGGAGCHQDLPFEQVDRTRSVCLVCHQDMRDHRPGGDCAECHALEGPGFGAARP